MATLEINGKKYPVENRVTVKEGTIYVDGVAIPNDKSRPRLNISISGDIKNLFIDEANIVKIDGNVENYQGDANTILTKDITYVNQIECDYEVIDHNRKRQVQDESE